MRPHCAVFCHRSIAADCCPARFADEFQRRAFNASSSFQSVRWLFRSIGLESRTPSYSLLSARADAFLTPCAIQCRLSILRGVLVVFFLVAFFLGRNKKLSSRWKTATRGKPIGRALAALDVSSLSRNRLELFCAQPAHPSTADRKIAPRLCGAIASIR